MQKKLIALAVAGLLSAPAFAQTNVTLYGTIDYGFASLGKHVNDNFNTRNGIDSGISKANRIGFKGVEDLGNGLKAVFVLETGLNGDIAGMFNDTARQTYAGLAGGFGTVAFGRHYTPQHLFTSAVDPFGKNGLGSAGNVMMQERRLNNLAAYISPNWGGFSFIASYSFNGTEAFARQPVGGPATFGGGDEPASLDGNTRVQTWSISPSFTWNNLFVGANYHNAKVKKLASGNSLNAVDMFGLYASYDFGFVKVGSALENRISDKRAYEALGWSTTGDVKLLQWMLGATFRITPNDSILTSYTRARENVNDKARIGQWAIGYEHALSKRTALYAQFATQSWNDAARDVGFYSIRTDGPIGGVGISNLKSNAEIAGYRRGFAVGFRHDF